MLFGWTTDRENAFAVLDAYVEAGGNFIDTADIYSRWASGNPGGVAEEILGDWMAERGNRDQLVIATKVRGRMGEGENAFGLSRRHIREAVLGSLRRLKTDRIDLYQTHWIDKDTPIEETLRALDDLVAAGDVHYLGASNSNAWRLARALWASEVHGLARYESLQPRYNLVHRDELERELIELVADQGLGLLPYAPLAAGFLTGKYRADRPAPDSARAARIQETMSSPRHWAVLDAVTEVAAAHDATCAQVALAWLLANPLVTAPIFGANTVAQLDELLPALDLQLGAEERSRLDMASDWRDPT
jgi:aryl-alcohol dehydrogenase-like predicted oxidoreductase